MSLLSLSPSLFPLCLLHFIFSKTHTYTHKHTPTCSTLECPLSALSPADSPEPLDFIFMHVNESHEGNRTPSRVKRVERGSERILSALVKASAGWCAHTHTHRLMPVQRCATGRSDWEYYLSLVKARQLDMQKLTRHWCDVFSFFPLGASHWRQLHGSSWILMEK